MSVFLIWLQRGEEVKILANNSRQVRGVSSLMQWRSNLYAM